MKRLLILLFIILISLNLSAGDKVKIHSKKGRWLTIQKGEKDGVKIGMKGKVQKIIVEGGEEISFNLGIFVVKKVTENSAELYIERIGKNANPKEAVQVEFYKKLEKELSPPEKIRKLKAGAHWYIKKKSFKRAAVVLKQASALKPNDQEVNALLEGLALINAPGVSCRDYFHYKAKNPGSLLLDDLKKKLYDTNRGLPPGKYLDETVKMVRNTKGYYEMEFKNSHVMIYIPGLELFVDKYEVSNSRYLEFLAYKGHTPENLKFSTLKNYPFCCKNHPAVVSYEQAEEYCRTNKMRLPTEQEWEIIAGRDKGKYPWGNAEVDESNVYRANFESLDDGYIDLAPVDSYGEFASPYGVVNMIGNVSEWVKAKLNKGGGFLSEKEELKITIHSKDTAYVGFRCVMEVER
jgi:hypothetical protein